MRLVKESTQFKLLHVAPLLTLLLAIALLYPFCQYYVDPDSTSYLIISRRYANGDWQNAINGLWSPLGCWLTAIFIKLGIAELFAALLVNTIAAVGFLYVSISLYKRFDLASDNVLWLGFCQAFFLSMAVYWQLFDDLWQCFFLTFILYILLKDDFITNSKLWLFVGLLTGLAVFSKAYSLPFLMLVLPITLYVKSAASIRSIFKPLIVIFSVTACVIAPWVYLLHLKYGVWTTSLAGKMIFSWFLIGHPVWRSDIITLLPPAHNGSVYYWEDPYLFNGLYVHFWDTQAYFIRQVLRVGYTTLLTIKCLFEISLLLPLTYLSLILIFIKKRYRNLLQKRTLIVAFWMLLLPLGYITVHVESRYLWVLLPLSIVLYSSLQALPEAITRRPISIKIFALSLLVFPIYSLFTIANIGKEENKYAEYLSSSGISSKKIVSNLHPRHLGKICYFSKNQFYTIVPQVDKKDSVISHNIPIANTEALIKDITRYNVEYYMHYSGENWLLSPGYNRLFNSLIEDKRLKLILIDKRSDIELYQIIK